ncbi:MAG: DUF4397 domain-containing protein [Gemmatimonadaceae bacterium]|nr:DUF4397 domain-containing protein [Gemmatimonadaceae bacterium]
MRRTRLLVAALPLLIGACDDNPTLGRGSSAGTGVTTASVRLVNATGTPLDLVSGGRTESANGAIAPGSISTCVAVDPATTSVAVQQTGATQPITRFTQGFLAGTAYTIIAYPTPTGSIQLSTLSTVATTSPNFTPVAGQAQLRVFNGTGFGTYDVYVTGSGAPLTTANAINVTPGTGTALITAPAGTTQVRLTNAGSQTVVFDAGAQSFATTAPSVLVIAPSTVTGALRSFVVPSC